MPLTIWDGVIWEHYHYDIDETKILNDIDAIEASGIPVRYVLIDDGHIVNKNRQLTSLVPDKNVFRTDGAASWSADKQIKMDRVMVQPSGYWMGISVENDFPPEIRQVLHHITAVYYSGTSKKR